MRNKYDDEIIGVDKKPDRPKINHPRAEDLPGNEVGPDYFKVIADYYQSYADEYQRFADHNRSAARAYPRGPAESPSPASPEQSRARLRRLPEDQLVDADRLEMNPGLDPESY